MAVYQSLSLTQLSQDYEGNSSQVRILWQSTQTGISYNNVQHIAEYTVSINGHTVQNFTTGYTLPKQTTVTIADATITVPHNSQGEGYITVTTSMDTRLEAGVVEQTKSLQLSVIPRASVLTASDAVIGGKSRLTVSQSGSLYTHSISYAFGSLSGYINGSGQVQSTEARFSGGSVDFTIPTGFYGQIPAAKSGTCRVTLRTYYNDVLIGQPQTTSFAVTTQESACLPTVSGTVVDINETTKALTGDEKILVRSVSQALCTATASAKNSAYIDKTYIAGTVVSDGTLLLAEPQTNSFPFYVVDSRGYSAYSIVDCQLIPYIKPNYEIQIDRPNTTDGTASLFLRGPYFNGSFGKVSNTLSVTYSINGGAYKAVDTLKTASDEFAAWATVTGISYNQVYTFSIRVADRLFTVEKQMVLKKSTPVFDWGEHSFSFHVPVKMDTPLAVENGGTGSSTAADACSNLGLLLPMQAGQEYETMERWNGKTVYTMLVNFGSLPNNAVRVVAHKAAASQILGFRGSISDGKGLPWGGSRSTRADLYCDKTYLYIDTSTDFSSQTAMVQIWYIK